MPGMPRQDNVCVRPSEAGKVRALRDVPQRRERLDRELEGWPDDSQGRYIMLRVPDHPRAKRFPYVFEHILIAERVLGRYLEPGESVHHRWSHASRA
jgi:hypothetical protein